MYAFSPALFTTNSSEFIVYLYLFQSPLEVIENYFKTSSNHASTQHKLEHKPQAFLVNWRIPTRPEGVPPSDYFMDC